MSPRKERKEILWEEKGDGIQESGVAGVAEGE
jgi:hypothetical protein